MNTTGGGGAASAFMQIFPLIAIIFLGYWLLLRPQFKRMKEHEAMQGGVKRGDKVVTNGGLVGKVTKAGDDELVIDVGPSGTKLAVRRSMVAVVVNPTPANDTDKKSKKK